MNIFVTGGAGYIGSAMTEALLKAGHKVTVYDALYTGHRQAIPEGARFVHADLA
ncbi:MAG: NAD-dependent epimerase/dehydratase family protein, partial [Chloroflexota bacterium]